MRCKKREDEMQLFVVQDINNLAHMKELMAFLADDANGEFIIEDEFGEGALNEDSFDAEYPMDSVILVDTSSDCHNNTQSISNGDYIVTYPNGFIEVFSRKEFLAKFIITD